MPEQKRFSRVLTTFAIVIAAVYVSGCAQTQVRQKANYQETQKSVSVLLMPVDIELSSLTAGGISEVRADWTASGKELVTQALRQNMALYDDRLLDYVEPDDPEQSRIHIQLVKLHSVVGSTLLLHSLAPATIPPTKKNGFDWSLGEQASALRDTSGADYGLFVFLRDSYATAGRKALIVASAALGIGLQGGTQIGFATLVDLTNGNVVWFNRILSSAGDLRTAEAANDAVQTLIKGIPLS